ncbi:hypothetical protein INS49_003873 [Diaporthe citri]|uniref:uncharacterized protein n=1 Tax=Diaporthe citri TaxID=83186 RepID=UPI001C7F0574|nr:uncharacterized protein INS49_003873 [Diaporthe citri]KAG6354792.1 hypothetical protein INS49_003873 [Diaporthe citri]
MAVDSLRRGRGFHKRRHRPNAVREEIKQAAKAVVRDSVEPPLVRRQGKGKGGNGKGVAAEPLPTAAAPSSSIVLDAGNPAETIVPPLNPPSTVAPPPPAPPPPPPDAPRPSSSSSSLTTSTAVTSVQTTQTSIQTQTTVITTAQTSTEVSTQVTTIVSTQIDTWTFPVGSLQMTVTLTSSMITSPLPTLQTSLSTAVSTTTPLVATTPYQAAPSSTTTSAAASRAPAIAPGNSGHLGILSFFIILGAVCLCSRRTRQRLLTPVTRRFTNNTLVNSGSRGLDSTGRRSGRGGGGGDMHKSLVSEAESMAYTATSPRDAKAPPPQMAMADPPRGLSQNPVFPGAAAACPSRPDSWRTWRPSVTFAQGLDPVPDDMQPPPPPPHALTARYSSGLHHHPRGSGVSTGEDSSMPEYGAWPPTASNADPTALRPAPEQAVAVAALAPEYMAGPPAGRAQSREYFQQQQGQELRDGHEHASYVTYSETPLATPRTPIVVEGEQLAPLATSQEASPVDSCDSDSGEKRVSRDAGATAGAGGDDIWWVGEPARVGRSGSGKLITIDRNGRRVGGGDDDDSDDKPEGGIQEAQLGRQAGEGGGHGGGAQGVEAEPPREQGRQQPEQGQQGEPGERGEQVFQEVAAVQGQRGLRASTSGSRRSSLRAPSSWDGAESTGSSSDAGFSWSEAASEPYTAAAPRDGFGLSIIGARHGSRSAGTGEGAGPGPSTTRPDEDA